MEKKSLDRIEEAAYQARRRIEKLVGSVLMVIGTMILVAALILLILIELGFRATGIDGSFETGRYW